ncbi:hypothetical protein CERSUDRAFT_107906 [Gelatoporia subvermispora B]|uniref:Terpene synthase n=1 Tax=Ceriporiopsis subvermispora (strain B) TaxID=914234 RepID=M2PE69_CERS8|nr:hypothetical protein CERSUDRAFT_107906 [Gelatoporia subvermispora B]
MCPFEGSVSPHYPEAADMSSAWITSFNMFKDRKREFFLQMGSELLCAHVYWYADFERFRACCDFVNILFTLDEISDEQNEKDARKTGLVFLSALRDASFDDGSRLCKMSQDFRARLAKHSGPTCYRRFVGMCNDYIEAVAVEADLRERGVILDVEPYMLLRRENSAVRFCFGLFEYILGMDLPDEIYDHPVFRRMHLAAIDMVCWANDLYSYNMEQAMGHTTNNIMSVLMKHKQVDLQGASDIVGVHFKGLMDGFLADKERLPSWGPELDADVSRIVDCMEQWVVGNLDWSFETQRYFGRDHLEIQRTLVVKLSPKRFEDSSDEESD